MIFVSREMSFESMDVSVIEQYGPVPPQQAGDRVYLGQPYPTNNSARDHTFGVPADHYSCLAARICALEIRVDKLQKKMEEWDEWYNDWNPLLKLLYRIFHSLLWKPRERLTDSAGSDVAGSDVAP